MGDRRVVMRPCAHRWGRVGPHSTVQVRVRHGEKLGGIVQSGYEPVAMILECPDCHQPIEFLTSSAGQAAA